MISRRDFLQLCGASLASLALPSLPAIGKPEQVTFHGRALTHVPTRSAPRPGAAVMRTAPPDAVLRLREAGEGWFKTADGYVAARDVQPMVPYTRPEVFAQIPAGGPFWAEVIAPVTVMQRWPMPDAPAMGRLGYGAVIHVVDVQTDDWGTVWYRGDERAIWVQGLHARRVEPDADFLRSPSFDTADKILRINLADCRLAAVADGRDVFAAPVSPGIKHGRSGVFDVTAKRPSTSMMGKAGVPWVVTIRDSGLVLHGAYWHNHFGSPRGDGSIALAPAVARWVYRWVEVGRTRVVITSRPSPVSYR